MVLFDGYLAVYEEGRDDAGRTRSGGRLPQVNEGAGRQGACAARADQHFTEPPPRYSEASLVKKMEELGIGRPSTYASILTVLRDRDYVRMDKNRFVPEDKGRLVTAFLEEFFLRYVEYDFTADLEEKLDLVSAGELDWKALLRDFWKDFHAAVGEIGELRMGQVLEAQRGPSNTCFFVLYFVQFLLARSRASSTSPMRTSAISPTAAWKSRQNSRRRVFQSSWPAELGRAAPRARR